MPQLNPHDFAPQLIWLAIIFTLFYLALARSALPRIAQVIANRKATIEGVLNGAREAQQRADREAAHYEAAIAGAKAKAQASIHAARQSLGLELSATRDALDRQLGEKAAGIEKSVQDLLKRASGEMETM